MWSVDDDARLTEFLQCVVASGSKVNDKEVLTACEAILRLQRWQTAGDSELEELQELLKNSSKLLRQFSNLPLATKASTGIQSARGIRNASDPARLGSIFFCHNYNNIRN